MNEKFKYDVFKEEDVEEILRNIEYDLFEIFGSDYGDYALAIFNDREKIIVLLSDSRGNAENSISKEKFIEFIRNNELEKYLNNVIYYNYVCDYLSSSDEDFD